MSCSFTKVLPEGCPAAYDLTVITVCRNVLPELKRTTASVLGQKAISPHISIEHIVVDAASEDGTAEWLAGMKQDGKIEAYVSEPDRGIYDAMNKGINMAHGRVLLFLNADDTFTHADLTPCLAPILSGQTRLTAAVSRLYDDSKVKFFRPTAKRMYIVCPICHQAFFAETALYRELGGYRAEMFRCAADTDFMYRSVNQEGFPPVIDSAVTNMPLGGFSHNCADEFCDEFISLLCLNKDFWAEHCRQESAYCDAMVCVLLKHCLTLRRWPLRYKRDISVQIHTLQELCRELRGICTKRAAKAALQYAADVYLDTILRRGQCTMWQWFRIRRFRTHCDIPHTNPYVDIVGRYEISLCNTMQHYLRKVFRPLHRKSPRV